MPTKVNRNSRLYLAAIETAYRCLAGQRTPVEIKPMTREKALEVVIARHKDIPIQYARAAIRHAFERLAQKMMESGSSPYATTMRIQQQAEVTLWSARKYVDVAKKNIVRSALYGSEEEARAHITTNLWNVVADPASKPSDRVAALRELASILLSRRSGTIAELGSTTNYITQIVQMIESGDRLPVATQDTIDALFASLPPPPVLVEGPLPSTIDEPDADDLGPIEPPVKAEASSNGKHRNPLLPPDDSNGSVEDTDLEDLL